ncbi:MAG: hypothetical protein KatS3mg108_3719 [Isosphaeraceae bacterium]|jgi:hypothetical protein|nr:MAG: hypothetical protein KatS3mg108_3719 [Isosphaeraceae bacterium]
MNTIAETPRRPGVVAAWDGFFFTPADPRPLALIRIVVGGLLLWSWLWLGADLRATLGSDGWADPAAAQARLPVGGWSIWFAVPDAWLEAVWGVGLVALGALTCGLGARWMAPLSWVLVVSTMRRAPVMLFGFDHVIATWLLYLAIGGGGGQVWAVRPAGRSPSVAANLALRLIQLHLCLIYASAGLAKLQGRPWWDGTAVGMLLGNSEFRPFDLSFLADHPRWLELATHATVWLEILYPVLIWFRGWRPWLLGGAVAMHLGIAVAMGLTEFSLAMIAGNLAFVRPEWLDAAGRLVGRRSRP